MTNKTTEQDMEAKSVDTNDATTIKASKVSGEVASESFGDDATQHATHEDSQMDLPEEPSAIEEEVDYSIIEPGSLSRALKKCRDEADMSVEDAAQEMRLPLSIVNALESESFADLPDPPYVRGYLRSYTRLNESDPGNLINHYETLRGADPKDIASFTPTTPRYQPGSKKSVSPTTIKLAGFSMIIMLMVVLSMIPAVSQWASDTWQSFSEPQQQRLASGDTPEQNAETQAANNTNTEQSENTPETQSTQHAASMSDAATPDKSEQIAVNQEATDTAAQDRKTAADSAEVADQDKQPEQVAASAESDTGESGTPTPSEDVEKSAESPDRDSTTDKEQDIARTDQEKTATTASDSDTGESATGTNTDAAAQGAAKAETAAAEEAAATAKKAEADKLAAQQAAARRNDNFKQPIDGSVLIRLVFTQPVWMSIKDGRGKTIFASLNAAGTRKELRANTPLQFKVGNAQGVQIYLNGQLVDQRPHTRGSVSTFRAH